LEEDIMPAIQAQSLDDAKKKLKKKFGKQVNLSTTKHIPKSHVPSGKDNWYRASFYKKYTKAEYVIKRHPALFG